MKFGNYRMINRDIVSSLAKRAGFSSTYELDRLVKLVELVVEELDTVMIAPSENSVHHEHAELAIILRNHLKDRFKDQ